MANRGLWGLFGLAFSFRLGLAFPTRCSVCSVQPAVLRSWSKFKGFAWIAFDIWKHESKTHIVQLSYME